MSKKKNGIKHHITVFNPQFPQNEIIIEAGNEKGANKH